MKLSPEIQERVFRSVLGSIHSTTRVRCYRSGRLVAAWRTPVRVHSSGAIEVPINVRPAATPDEIELRDDRGMLMRAHICSWHGLPVEFHPGETFQLTVSMCPSFGRI